MNNYASETLEYAPKHDAVFCAHMIRAALAKGWTVSVCDGEEWTVKKSRDAETIFNALATTDNDTLRFRDANGAIMATAWVIYGNSPGETLADYGYNTKAGELFMDTMSDFCMGEL